MAAQVSSGRGVFIRRVSLERLTLKVETLKRSESAGNIYRTTLCNNREDLNHHCQLHCLGRSLEIHVSSLGVISVTIYVLWKIAT